MAKKRVEPDAGISGDTIYAGLGVSQDEIQIGNDGKQFMSFFKGLAGFFLTATAMEKTAASKLERAKAFVPPTTADEDVALQEFVKSVNADDEDIDNHWGICGILFRLHRKTTEGRDRGKNLNKQSRQLGTKLHNDYTEGEKRRAAQAQETERRRREAIERADQETKALEAEAEAVKREQASPDLSERETIFVDAVVQSYGRVFPEACAKRAGYKEPSKAGERLMKTPKIIAAVNAKQDAIRLRKQADAIREQPVEVRTEEVKPDIKKATNTHDRTVWGAEVLDPAALLQAVLAGVRAGDETIPTDILMINEVAVNAYGKKLHEQIDRWAGVRHTKKTSIV